MAFNAPSEARFSATHWSVIVEAKGTGSSAEQALAQLCQKYRYPIYAFLRRKGETPHDAEDLTQGFFATEAEAQAQRLERDAMIESIKDFRIEIQYAIDAEYGPGDPANSPVRREFDLPTSRPFNAVKRKSA